MLAPAPLHTPVLLLGSGPIVIGRSAEFGYSGTQACKALRQAGYRIVLVNPNPATIMTDSSQAEATYMEPLDARNLERIIEAERPELLLPGFGGRTGLDLASELSQAGVLARYGVQVIGVDLDAIERCQDRLAFKNMMRSLGIATPESAAAGTLPEAEAIALRLGYPAVIRPAGSTIGVGTAVVRDATELAAAASTGLQASSITRILVEESVAGWEELEVEVLRDASGKMVVACFIENIDPMGVHSGDSACVSPMLGVGFDVQRRIQEQAFRIADRIGLVGCANVQFAYDQRNDRVVVIDFEPRASRSSALASKAAGFPIALISAKLAVGGMLKDIPYWRDGSLDSYSVSGDYVAVKLPRWAFEDSGGEKDRLGARMKAAGEAMSLGKTFKEAFQKAVRSLENGRYGLGFAKDFNLRSKSELLDMLREPSSERLFVMYEAMRKGASTEELYRLTRIKRYFLAQLAELAALEERILRHKGALPPDELLVQAKKDGFSDKYLAWILGVEEQALRRRRQDAGARERWQAVPVSGVAFAYYYYSTYNGKDEVAVSPNYHKVMILGGGPNRIGQGVEYDYCCVQAAQALRELGYETIMVNCNPETVSTDYDASDRLYLEPLTVEDVLAIWEKEKPSGAIVQFGGQASLAIARELSDNGVRLLGTGIDSIEAAEDRELFRRMMDKLGIPMPESGMAESPEAAQALAERIGYPVISRSGPSRGEGEAEILRDEDGLRDYLLGSREPSRERPLRLERFLEDALECEAEALADGKEVYIPAVMEHIELSGVHRGDSACVLPPVTISEASLRCVHRYTREIALALGAIGLMNVRYAIRDGTVYALEATLRATRTLPFVSKVCGLPLASMATRLMLAGGMKDIGLSGKKGPVRLDHFGVRQPVFPFDRFPEIDPILGSGMLSTGEVMGMADSFELAFFKAAEASGSPLPDSGTVLMSLYQKGARTVELGRAFDRLGFKIKATEGTARFLFENGIPCSVVKKLNSGRPNVVDAIASGEIQLVVNAPAGNRSQAADAYIRKAAIAHGLPCLTTLASGLAAAKGIEAARAGKGDVKPLQQYHRDME
jgi:carbamoyl-phosphate synthase large subunit